MIFNQPASLMMSLFSKSLSMEDHPARRCHTFQKTKPGFTMVGEKYKLKFMSACSLGLEEAKLSDLGDWRCFMRMVLREAEKSQGDMLALKTGLVERIREKMLLLSPQSPLVSLYDEPYFPLPRGKMRRVKIEILDRYNTTVELCLIKISSMASLLDLCIGAVSNRMNNGLDINAMELPDTLKEKLRAEYYNRWCCKRFPSYNIHLLPYKDAIKRKLALNMEKDKEPKRPRISLHRVQV